MGTIDTPTNRRRSQQRVNSSSSLKKQPNNESQTTGKMNGSSNFSYSKYFRISIIFLRNQFNLCMLFFPLHKNKRISPLSSSPHKPMIMNGQQRLKALLMLFLRPTLHQIIMNLNRHQIIHHQYRKRFYRL